MAPRTRAKSTAKPTSAGGWGSLKAVASILTQEQVPVLGGEILRKQNRPDGFMCVSCSWAKPAKPHLFEFCENGAKATAWEITSKTTPPVFFGEHTVTELRTWSDHRLEEHGRLTHPMRYDAGSDRYLPVTWEQAFAEIGRELKALDPKSVIFTAPAGRRWKRAICINCSAGCMGPTISPTARTCATNRLRWLCLR